MMENEKQLIDPDMFLQWAVKRFKCVPLVGSSYNDQEDMKSLLAQAPTVDAVEVVHGRWISQYYSCWINGQRWRIGYYCSACMGFNKVESHYCPHCGAKMDLEVR